MSRAARTLPVPSIDALTEAVVSILAAMEAQPVSTPVLTAFGRALRRKGEEIASLGGHEMMVAVVDRAAAVTIGRGPSRRAALAEAWSDLPEWRAA